VLEWLTHLVFEILDLFRIRFAGRPLLLSVACFAILAAVRRRRARSSCVVVTPAWSAVILVGSSIALAAYAAIAIWYARDPHYFDNAEPTLTAVGWLFRVGQPVYHSPQAAERYAHIYGPMAYVIHGLALAAFGPHIEVSKTVGVSAGLLSLGFVYGACRKVSNWPNALAFSGLCALMMLLFRDYSFWTRPDPIELLAMSASLFVATGADGFLAVGVVGFLSGVLWNLKFTGPLYSLPVFVVLHARIGWRGTVAAGGMAAIIATLPFVVFPNISFANYLVWLRLPARTGLLLSTLRQNLEWAAYFGLPILLTYVAIPRERRPLEMAWRHTLLALMAGSICIVVAGAKPGAGPYHLIPFLPVIMYVSCWQAARCPQGTFVDRLVLRAALAVVVAALAIALVQQAQFLRIMAGRARLHEIGDIEAFTTSHSGVVEMGYGDTESMSLERPVLVFLNRSYLLDQPAMREYQLEGLAVPEATTEAMEACRVDYWLIPRDEAPFASRNSYAAVYTRPLFPDEFRRVFVAAYRRVSTTTYYDVWACRSRASK
jgi:hypothetical protein